MPQGRGTRLHYEEGAGESLVVMSLAKYEQLAARLALSQQLGVAENQSLSPEGRASHEELMNRLRRRLND